MRPARTFGTGSVAHRWSGWQPSTISDASVMEIPNDFRELLELFNAHKVEYLVVGGYALAFHDPPHRLCDSYLAGILALAFGPQMRYC